MKKKIRVRRHRRRTKQGNTIVQSHYRKLKRPTKKVMKIDETRFCYKCKSILYYKEYKSANPNLSEATLRRIWESPLIELYCCSCLDREISGCNLEPEPIYGIFDGLNEEEQRAINDLEEFFRTQNINISIQDIAHLGDILDVRLTANIGLEPYYLVPGYMIERVGNHFKADLEATEFLLDLAFHDTWTKYLDKNQAVNFFLEYEDYLKKYEFEVKDYNLNEISGKEKFIEDALEVLDTDESYEDILDELIEYVDLDKLIKERLKYHENSGYYSFRLFWY
jgi:hypothetical protein